MQLKTAIERAIRFCPKGKDAPDTLKQIRFVPALGAFPARIYSTAGHLGVLIDVEADLPNAVLAVAALRNVVRSSKKVEAIEEAKLGVYQFAVEDKKSGELMTYRVNGGETSAFPGYPELPVAQAFEPISHWSEILKVLPTIGKEASKPELGLVCFGGGCAVTTDEYRATCVEMPSLGDRSAFVPGEIFRSFPKGEVAICWTDTYLFVRVGDELRFAALQSETTQHKRLRSFFGAPPYASVIVDTVLLRETITRALASSPWHLVALSFGDVLGVSGFIQNREGDACAAFDAEINYHSGVQLPGKELLVNGKFLLETLKRADSPRVRLGYGSPEDVGAPLRVESGWARTAIWPAPWEETLHGSG